MRKVCVVICDDKKVHKELDYFKMSQGSPKHSTLNELSRWDREALCLS